MSVGEGGRFTDEVFLISGANRGIGAAILRHLGKEGAFVAGGARNDEGLSAIDQILLEEEVDGMAILLDANNMSTFARAREEVVKEAEMPITGLVNNAGTTIDTILMRMSEADIREVIEVNLIAPTMLLKEVLPAMVKARKGNILNISSVVGIHGEYGQANYAASKGGLNGVTRSAAREYEARNIRINALALGLVDTRMTQGLPEEITEKMIAEIPMGRALTPDEAAEAALDTMASGMNGEIVVADGGYTLAKKNGGNFRYWGPGTGLLDL